MTPSTAPDARAWDGGAQHGRQRAGSAAGRALPDGPPAVGGAPGGCGGGGGDAGGGGGGDDGKGSSMAGAHRCRRAGALTERAMLLYLGTRDDDCAAGGWLPLLKLAEHF